MATDSLVLFRRFHRLALAALALVFLQIVLGSTVRATGSGMGCPDWPLCHGTFLPALDFESCLEYSHRAVGALVSTVSLIGVAWIAFDARLRRSLGLLAGWMTVLIVALVTFGAVTVAFDMPPAVVACHLELAGALAVVWLTIAQRAGELARPLAPAAPSRGFYRGWSLVAFGCAIVQVFLGALVSVSHAGLACPDFPTCYGMWLPPMVGNVALMMIHRFGAYTVAGSVFVLVALAEWQAEARVRRLARAAGLLVLVQIALGISMVLLQVPVPISVTHLATGMTLFITLYASVYASFPRLWAAREDAAAPAEVALPVEEPARPAARLGEVLKAYYQLTKPAIVMLVVLTGLPAILIATGNHPDLVVAIAALVGTSLAAGSAAVFNQYFERERDKVMTRTAKRPIPSGLVPANAALAFGIALGVLAMAILLVWTNWLAAAIALAGLLFYGFFYTLVLKDLSPQNIVVGGAAGASAPLICWAAVTGQVGLPAWIMFAIVFVWTPPHFWALAIFKLEDYIKAELPMYPVVYGVPATARWIVIYSLLLVPISMLLVPLHAAGPIYLAAALGLGLGFLFLAGAVLRTQSKRDATKLFAYSIVYTLALFSALTIDAACGGPTMVHGLMTTASAR